MFDLRLAWPLDLPVCFPGRQCVDEPPLAAPMFNVILAMTASSSVVAAACFVVLGAAIVLLVLGLLRQWRVRKVRPWLAILAAAMLLVGVVLAYALDAWFGTIALIYSDLYGEPSALAPESLTGSWPSVLAAGRAMAGLAVVALFLILTTAVVRRRRDVAG